MDSHYLLLSVIPFVAEIQLAMNIEGNRVLPCQVKWFLKKEQNINCTLWRCYFPSMQPASFMIPSVAVFHWVFFFLNLKIIIVSVYFKNSFFFFLCHAITCLHYSPWQGEEDRRLHRHIFIIFQFCSYVGHTLTDLLKPRLASNVPADKK